MTVQRENGLKLAEEAIQKLREEGVDVLRWHINGSVAINGQGNDLDLVVLVPKLVPFMLAYCYARQGGQSYESAGTFESYRDGDVNILLMEDAYFYENWLTAREVCRVMGEYGFEDRDFRVRMFSIICDGKFDHGVS